MLPRPQPATPVRLLLLACLAGLVTGCGGESPAGPRHSVGIEAIAISPGSLAYTPGATACDVQVDNAVAVMSFTVTLASAGDSLTIGGVPAADSPAFDPAVTSYTVQRVGNGSSNTFLISFTTLNDAATVRTTYPRGGQTVNVGSATRTYTVTVNIVAAG